MTAFLASVASLGEAERALKGGAEILDLKDPCRGVLGAWPMAGIREAVAWVAGRLPVSATVGDLPMDPETVVLQVRAVAATGVTFVKVGLFDEPGRDRCIEALGDEACGAAAVIAVLFADLYSVMDALESLARARLAGVMLDTARKGGNGLRTALNDADLARFVAAAKKHGLLTGLAGSLSLDDVAPLAALGPDVLGFRGALCADSGRANALDRGRVESVALAVRAARSAYDVSARQATLTAGAAMPAQ